jgi:CRP/FNR family transcriptional regulator, cyclic AMP receptor protein
VRPISFRAPGVYTEPKGGNLLRTKRTAFDPKSFLAKVGEGRTLTSHLKNQPIFAQGDPADSLFYIQKGKVKLTVVSKHGKEAIVAVLGPTDFFGEGCLAGQPKRMATASALVDCSIVRIAKPIAIEVIRKQPKFSELLLTYLLSRNIRIEEDLVDRLFNSSEKRLARILLLLANFGKNDRPEQVIPKISQETLAEMVGTTRARVSFFMNKFRKLGFVSYDGGLEVHNALLNVILHDSDSPMIQQK